MQADYHLASPQHLFRAYTLLLAAQRAAEAHRIAAEDLVPEALVRGDYPLVRQLLEPFLLSSSLSPEPEPAPAAGEPSLDGFVSGWKQGGGQTYLLFLTQPDYPHLLARAMQAVQALSKRVKESSRLRSKKLLRLAIAEMEGRLTVLAKANTASKVSPPDTHTLSGRSLNVSRGMCSHGITIHTGSRANPAVSTHCIGPGRLDPGSEPGILAERRRSSSSTYPCCVDR